MVRYGGAAVAAAVVTFALFFLMQSLIAMGLATRERKFRTTPIEIVRVERESETERMRRKPRQAEKAEEPPPPPIRLARAPEPRLELDTSGPSYLPDFLLAGTPGLGPSPSDADVTPLFRVPPQYPPRAQERGTEGWVLLEFTISKTGTPQDVVVVDAEPSRIFDRAAIRAVRKWKYKPKIKEGQPVARAGVQHVIRFELDED